MENHEPFLHEAIALSKSAVEHGDEPFGSLLVKGGDIILRAENSVYTGHDMTNHAEMNLIKLAAKQYDTAFLDHCTIYTSTEPCAMCSGAIYWSGIGRMVFACSETRLGEIAGQTTEILHRIDALLKEAGTDRDELIQANIWLRDLMGFDEMNAVWEGWVTAGTTPRRTTFEDRTLPRLCDIRVDVIAWRKTDEFASP